MNDPEELVNLINDYLRKDHLFEEITVTWLCLAKYELQTASYRLWIKNDFLK